MAGHSNKKRFSIEFDGFTDMIAEFDRLEGDLKAVTEDMLKVIPDMVNPELHQAMQKHKRTGRTERSIVENPPVEWDGNVASISVGFEFAESGLTSIFLMYGTARHAPKNQYGGAKNVDAKINPGMKADRKLFNAIYSKAIKEKIGEKQEEILAAAINKRLGG
jgi:hypothetical protein